MSFLFNAALFCQTAIKITDKNIPLIPREMRGVWIATVANIDWPSKPGLSTEDQKKEALLILDRAKALNLNTIIFQVRPQADALYNSAIEPWSFFLTGQMGKAPEPYYDPLEFWVKESHARGLELHAWFNPYRANHSAMTGEISPLSIIKTKPHCVKKLGNNGYYWINPAMKEGQDHSYNVVLDVVRRYDVDGVQFDDYFYPYWEYNDGKNFPDDDTYKAYQAAGGKLAAGDWRRGEVNKFIKRIYAGIKQVKPEVKFGISPFGVYRPGHPKSIGGGLDQFADLYSDAKLWLNKGWVDYFAPQLHWPISRVELSYPVLLNWWAAENTKGRNLWPGLFIRPEVEIKEMTREIVNQIMVARGMVPKNTGVMLFSMKSMIPQESITAKALIDGPYALPALSPAYPWLDKKAPDAPQITTEKKDGKLHITWSPQGSEKPFLYVLYTYEKSKWKYEILPGSTNSLSLPLEGEQLPVIAISAVDKCGNESRSVCVMKK